MKAKTEELLYLLLWSCNMLARPTFRNLTDSFESWAYRNGLRLELAELERRDLLESLTIDGSAPGSVQRVLRLTEAGPPPRTRGTRPRGLLAAGMGWAMADGPF